MSHRTCRSFLPLALSMLVPVVAARAAELQVHAATDEAGAQTTATLQFYTPGEVVSGLQFDLVYAAGNSLRIAAIEAHETLSMQDKVLQSSQPGPGILRILISGPNNYPMLNGPCLTIRFMGGDQSSIKVATATATDPNGSAVAVTLNAGKPSDLQTQKRTGRQARR